MPPAMATNTGPIALARAVKSAKWSGARSVAPAIRSLATVERREHEPHATNALPLEHTSGRRSSQKNGLSNAKPFSDFLTDTFNRQHDYLRISVTERCNLRCLYCMPEEGIQLSPNKELLTTAEIYYLSALFVNQGVNKIRLTGGEPTVRKDIVPLMQQIGSLRKDGLKELALTTNGISLHRKLDQMVEAGLTGVNISLDTLDSFEFQLLTRRQGYDAVMKSINRVHEMNRVGAGIKLKINCVVMRGLNDHQVLPFVEKTRDEDVEVRFIEYMPFGGNKWSQNKMLPYAEMLDLIRTKYPTIARMRDAKNDTSKTWQVPGFKGRIGFITSMTHNFCGTCNRVRITSDGNLKVCLHGNTEVSLRDLLRAEQNGEPLDEQAFDAIRQLELDRRKANGLHFDGREGWISKENELLGVIGAAVKRKQAKHAGMGALENMKNRPMILIGEQSHAKLRLPSISDKLEHAQSSSPTPWSRVPTHLLGQPSLSGGAVQRRHYSADARGKETNTKGSPDQEQPKPGFGSSFGFQSLTGLFQQPRQGRYSSPRTPEEKAAAAVSPQTPSTETSPIEADGRSLTPVRPVETRIPGHDTSIESMDPHHEAVSGEPMQSPNIRYELSKHAYLAPQSRRPMTRRGRLSTQKYETSTRPHEATNYRTQRAQPAVGHSNTIKRLPNPFSTDATTSRTADTHEPMSQPRASWGLNAEETKPIGTAAHSTPPSDPRDELVLSDSAPNSTNADAGPKLTHVTSTGEAHMVDVGAKTATKRVAIAITVVRFNNPEPFRLIFENSNKKGDVLGVARIAGIMAAKRTSDLIPLCHPLAISKVEVDVKLEAPGVTNPAFRSENKFGIVTVQGQVECTGPTGVEMEALTAVTGAALTVYDMCKAVDREMRIMETKVVYKSGGRSGSHCDHNWAHHVGKEFFAHRELQPPLKRMRVG